MLGFASLFLLVSVLRDLFLGLDQHNCLAQ